MNNIFILSRYHFWCIIIVLAFFSCKKEDQSPLEGCCDIPAINEDVGNGHIYAPNIFTPNFDGINDEFIVFTDSIRWIYQIEIKNKLEEVVFHFENYDPANWYVIWDGEVNGELVEGLYSVKIIAEAENGVTRTLEGEVCNYPCDDLNPGHPIDKSNCQFPAQNDDGRFNNNLPSGEGNDCFTN